MCIYSAVALGVVSKAVSVFRKDWQEESRLRSVCGTSIWTCFSKFQKWHLITPLFPKTETVRLWIAGVHAARWCDDLCTLLCLYCRRGVHYSLLLPSLKIWLQQ